MFRVTRILSCFLTIASLQKFTLAIEWKHVKPMYLVSMQQRALEMQTADKIDNNSKEDDAEVILNLEKDPILEDKIEGGTKAMDRIFGGDVAVPNCFPYQVGLLLQRPRGLYWCGGALISDEYVLTAAHCVDMAKRALIFLGANEIKNAKENGQVRVMVNRTNFIIFPTWNPRRLKDDIALVRLPVPIEFNDRIHPVALPKRSYEYRNFNNKLSIASGWGRYATGVHAISGILRFVHLRIINGHTCKRNFPLSYRSTNICTSGKNEMSTCNGDSGGPLVLQRLRSKERVLVGLTSFGSIHGCDRGFPAAFTKVASYLDWISDEAGVEPYDDSPKAVLFKRGLQEYQTSHNLLQCYERDPNDEEDEEENEDDYEDENTNDEEELKVIHDHVQKYPDGTLLRTAYFNG